MQLYHLLFCYKVANRILDIIAKTQDVLINLKTPESFINIMLLPTMDVVAVLAEKQKTMSAPEPDQEVSWPRNVATQLLAALVSL